MKILDEYILKETAKNIFLTLLILTLLFLVFDFFDRIDNVLEGDPELGTIISYFLYKIPVLFNFTMPIAAIIGTMLTLGVLSKNSEIIAMRASGIKIIVIAKPILTFSLILSLFSLIVNETLVPHSNRRAREIYNIDIKEKHKKGTYNKNDFWWRDKDNFYSVKNFDSRDNSLHDLSKFNLKENFTINKRIDANKTKWVNSDLLWNMSDITQYKFTKKGKTLSNNISSQPLIISETPKNFYNAKLDPFSMSFFQLKNFISEQSKHGIPTKGYYADLYSKLAFPFVIFIGTLIVIPFSVRPARSGSLAVSFMAGLIITFSYYGVHSISLALGRAEIWPPMLAAWMANILMGLAGAILLLGSEAPE